MTTEDWLKGIVRVCDRAGNTVGTGFLVAPDLAITCAHVVKAPREPLTLIFLANNQAITALLELDYWREPEREDIAILRLQEPLPPKVSPIFLGTSTQITGQCINTYGFTAEKPRQGMRGTGCVEGELKHENGCSLLQISSSQITNGFSGAPVVSDRTGRVVGMVTEILAPDCYHRGRDTAFATPSQVFWEICPQLAPKDICPYLGLSAFTEQEAEFFKGREDWVTELVDRLRCSPQFLAVVGASGSGKSSLVQAGLFPKLRQEPPIGFPLDTPIFQFRPSSGSAPEEALLAALSISLPSNSSLCEIFSAARSHLHQYPDRPILFVDQFEELFALFPERQEAFTRGLDDLLKSTRVTLILNLRSDFYGALQESALGRFLPTYQVNIPGGLNEAGLRAAIEQPAAQVGLQLESGLVDLLVTDLQGTKNPLPLLEFTLKQLWDKEHRENRLTRKAYLDPGFGRVTGAISQWATQTYRQLPTDAERTLTRRILTRLIRYGVSDRPDTRQPLLLDEVVKIGSDAELTRSLIQRLAAARLLVADDRTVEIIHDALIVEWAELRGWIEQQRPFLSWREGQLREKLSEWQTAEKSDRNLLYEADLSKAEAFLKENRADLTEDEREYIETSIKRRNFLQVQKIRNARRVALGSVAGIILLSLLTVWAFALKNISDEQRANAEIISLRLTAENLFASGRELEALMEAVKMGKKIKQFRNDINTSNNAQAIATLQDIFYKTSELTILNTTASGKYNFASFSDDGKTIITLGSERSDGEIQGVVKKWNLAGKLISKSTIKDRPIAISPDGRIVAAVQYEKYGSLLVKLYTPEGKEIGVVEDFSNEIENVVFSSGSNFLIASGYHKLVIFNILKKSKIVLPNKSREGGIRNIKIYPSNNSLFAVTKTARGTVNFLDLNGKEIAVLEVYPLNTSAVNDIAFSEDGKTLVTVGTGGFIKIWNLDSNKIKKVSSFGETIRGISSITTNFNGSKIVVSNREKIQIWDRNGRLIKELSSLSVNQVSINGSGEFLITNSNHFIQVWDIRDKRNETPANFIRQETKANGDLKLFFSSLAFQDVAYKKDTLYFRDDPDSFIDKPKVYTLKLNQDEILQANQLFKNSSFKEEKLVLPNGQSPVKKIEESSLKSIKVSPDGDTVALLYLNRIDLWSTIKRKKIKSLSIQEYPLDPLRGIKSVAFAQDGKVIAITAGNSLLIWDYEKSEVEVPIIRESAYHLLALSPDGKHLGLASGREAVISSTQNLHKLEQEPPKVVSIGSSDHLGVIPFGGSFPIGQSPTEQDLANLEDANYLLGLNLENTMPPEVSDVPEIDRDIASLDSTLNNIHLVDNCFEKENCIILKGHKNKVNDVEFSPDGKLIATASTDGTVKLWNLKGKELFTFQASDEAMTNVSFSDKGNILLGNDIKGKLIIWNLDLDDLLSRSCEWLQGYLTSNRRLHQSDRYLCDIKSG